MALQLGRLGDWIPAMACMVCWGLGVGLVGTYGMFVTPVASDFGASVAVVNSGLVLLLLVMAVVSPMAGWLSDRLPVEYLLLFGVTAGMTALYLVSLTTELVYALAGIAGFGIGLSFYSRAPITAFLARRYPDYLGRALAIAALGLSAVSMILPAWIGWLLEEHGWRDALAIMTMVLATVLVVSIAFGIRERDAPRGNSSPRAEPTASPRQAGWSFIRRPAFWLIGLSVAIFYTVVVALSISFPAHLRSIGISPAQVGIMLALAGSGGLAGKILFGAFSDRLRAYVHYLALCLVGVKICGISLLLSTTEIPLLVLGMAISGLGSGAFIPLHPFLNSCYFEQQVIGSVNGAQAPLMLPFSVAAVPLAGYVFDTTGSYLPAFAGMIGALLICVFLLLLMPRPEITPIPGHRPVTP